MEEHPLVTANKKYFELVEQEDLEVANQLRESFQEFLAVLSELLAYNPDTTMNDVLEKIPRNRWLRVVKGVLQVEDFFDEETN